MTRNDLLEKAKVQERYQYFNVKYKLHDQRRKGIYLSLEKSKNVR